MKSFNELLPKILKNIPNKDIINTQRGQWDYPGRITRCFIPGHKITMGPDPITGKPQEFCLLIVGDQSKEIKYACPGNAPVYFPNDISVTEYPIY